MAEKRSALCTVNTVQTIIERLPSSIQKTTPRTLCASDLVPDLMTLIFGLDMDIEKISRRTNEVRRSRRLEVTEQTGIQMQRST